MIPCAEPGEQVTGSRGFTISTCTVTRRKKEKLEYMHANPVVRGLVRHPKDWPWSSFSFYAKNEAGLAVIDAVDL